jgi:hypothetical protein
MTRLAVVMVMFGSVGCGHASRSAPTKQELDRTKLTVEKYAYEAFASWAASHPDKACPDRLDELNAYMNTEDSKDPWGTPYKMLCGSTAPAAARHGIGVLSAGPDQKFDTDDDIRSW